MESSFLRLNIEQIKKDAKIQAFQELEKELLEKKDYANLDKLTKLKESVLV